jgi:hypothetical protein
MKPPPVRATVASTGTGFEDPPHRCREDRAGALHLADLVDQEDIHGPAGPGQILFDERDQPLGFDAVTPHPNGRARPDVGQDRPSPAQIDRLEADPLPVLSQFQGQEARRPSVAKSLDHPSEHGGLAATRCAGQQQVLRCCGKFRDLSGAPDQGMPSSRSSSSSSVPGS